MRARLFVIDIRPRIVGRSHLDLLPNVYSGGRSGCQRSSNRHAVCNQTATIPRTSRANFKNPSPESRPRNPELKPTLVYSQQELLLRVTWFPLAAICLDAKGISWI